MKTQSEEDAIGNDIRSLIVTLILLEPIVEVARKVWSDLHVSDDIVRSLLEQKFFEPTPIQRMTLPAAIDERLDIIGAAETVRKNRSSLTLESTFLVD